MGTTTGAPLTIEDAELLVATARRAAEQAGVTVHRDGRLIGAIGVGGGAPDQDHGFALAAVQALA